MVKKLLKFFAYMLFFLFALMMFLPKESFYFFLEEQLKPSGVIVSNEHLNATLLGLELENLHISFKGIESAVIESADIKLFGLYNRVAFTKTQLSSLVNMYAPADIEKLVFTYTLLNPFEVTLDAQGDFGEARGSFSFLKRSVEAKVIPSELMQMQYAKSLKMLKKESDGEYSYAKTF